MEPNSVELLAAEIETLMRRLLRVDAQFFEDTVAFYDMQVLKMRAVRAVLANEKRTRRSKTA